MRGASHSGANAAQPAKQPQPGAMPTKGACQRVPSSGGLRHALLACCGCWQSGSSSPRSWCGWRVCLCLPPVRRSGSRCVGLSVVGCCGCGFRSPAVSVLLGSVRVCLVSRSSLRCSCGLNEVSHTRNLELRYLCFLLLELRDPHFVILC